MMTRQTGTLAVIEGDLTTDGGKVTLKEKDGVRNGCRGSAMLQTASPCCTGRAA